MLKETKGRFIVGLVVLLGAAEIFISAASPQGMDQDFAIKAANAGKAELEMGRLAAKKGRSAAVKSFARRMITDHTRAGNKLHMIATKKGITLPMDINAEAKGKMDQLSQLDGAAFDLAYMEMMVADHEKAVADFQTEASSGADADLKTFAAATLPTLKTHLRMAQQTAAKLK